MALALSLTRASPLGRKLRAWWNGYYLDEEPAAAVEIPNEKPKTAEPPPVGQRQAAVWAQPRIQVTEKVWGRGFMGPDDQESIATFIHPLTLDSKVKAANLGAGLGGIARAITEASGAWVSGYEASAELSEGAMELSTMAGLAKRAPIETYDPEAMSLKNSSFKAIIAKEAFYSVAGKEALFKAAFAALKSDGHLLFTDYIATKNGVNGAAIDEWRKHETKPVHLISIGEMRGLLERIGFEIRIAENESPAMCQRITSFWSRFIESVQPTSLDKPLGAALLDELMLWLIRTRVLESGEIGLYRIHAIKTARGSKR
jgi:cyclopropane fatty-acyl-phospholipid synthase-like methyltransferase